MKIRNKQDKIKTPGVFSITDIILNMFIFFFITFSLIAAFKKTGRESNIKNVDVPMATSGGGKAVEKMPLKVIINKTKNLELIDSNATLREITFTEEENTLNELKSVIKYQKRSFGAEIPDMPSVVIYANEEVVYDYVVKVLNAVKKPDPSDNLPGFSNVGITEDQRSSTQD